MVQFSWPGIPYYKIRMTAGDTEAGGHAYLTYYCESEDKWVAMDWCYYPDQNIPVKSKLDYKDSSLYGEVWFSFNERYAFSRGTKVRFNI